ncbi:MAG: Gfo/Idh/MocA family oxidoreductase [Oscillospiraceae bacterium]|jgi:predicted dehydrogenase|nr:Gfo/Idh/MocA family oxidoreductase [Oscillospiraceae bacterium]
MLRVAVIGTGNISPMHIQGYLAYPERCEITALCDIVPDKCREKNARFGLNAAVFDSHQALLSGAEIDLVSICTPPYTHAEIAVNCLKAGRHVLVEKPMAASVAECDGMNRAATASGSVVFSVVAQNRFRASVWNLKRVLDSGMIGKIVHAQIDSHWWRGHSYYDLWWRGLWEKEGGGPTLNHAVHHIDMLGWMMGLPDSVCAMMANTSHDNSEVEDLSVAVLRYANGALAQVTSSVVHHGEEQQVIFQGEKARVSAPWRVAASLSQPNGFPVRNTPLEEELTAFFDAPPPFAHEGHTGQIGDVLTSIERGGSPLVGGEDGRRTVELIAGIYKAASGNRTVTLPLDKDDPFRTVAGILQNVPRFCQKSAAVQELRGKITTGRSL